jgi:Polyketide cyclase / dehydrase and lipid transport
VIPADRWRSAYLSSRELAREIASGVRFWGYELDDWASRFYQRHGFELVSPEQTPALLNTCWSILARQIQTSVVASALKHSVLVASSRVAWDAGGVRIEQTFTVARPPEAVFDYMTSPEHLRDWQTSKTREEVLSEGQPRQGFRIREWTKLPGRKEFEQVVEFTQFIRPSRIHTHIVEGPQPIDGTWSLVAVGEGTRIGFVAEGALRGPIRLLELVVARMVDRQFRIYHENLRRNVESNS